MKKLLLVLSFALLLATGCSRSVQTKTTTEVTTSNGGATSETRETTTETEKKEVEPSSCRGVLSCTVDFVGDVIAFPFRLVGGLVQAIF